MGAIESHSDFNMKNLMRRNQWPPRKYSTPTILSPQLGANRRHDFYPPPILHTKFHEQLDRCLFQTDTNDQQHQQGVSSRRITINKVRSRQPENKNNNKSGEWRKSEPAAVVNESPEWSSKYTIPKTSTSSTSNSLDSAVGDDIERSDNTHTEITPLEKKSIIEHNESVNDTSSQQLKSKYGESRCSQWISLDSGDSFDEQEEDSNFIDSFETVFEEDDAESGNKSVLVKQPQKKISFLKKIRKKYSIVKSLREMRSRAFSLPDHVKEEDKASTHQLLENTHLNRKWEITSVGEMCRRLSLNQLSRIVLPLPEGATSSQLLDESMLRQLVDILPARACGYPWVNIYNSEKHGLSLHTFYRKMINWDQEMSPVLLVIRDCGSNVFGAVVSTTVRPSEYFIGTGDSCLLFKFVEEPDTGERELRSYRWSGENQFFVKASKDSLSIGASGGHYGLWLDADLDHGRSEPCDTFHNEPLAGETEDFTVQFIEAFGFCMA